MFKKYRHLTITLFGGCGSMKSKERLYSGKMGKPLNNIVVTLSLYEW